MFVFINIQKIVVNICVRDKKNIVQTVAEESICNLQDKKSFFFDTKTIKMIYKVNKREKIKIYFLTVIFIS